MGIYTTKYLCEAGEGDVNIPLDPEKDGFHSIDPLEDHEGEAAGELDPDPVIGVEEAYNIMYESECVYNELMESIGLHELKAYAESGSADIIYETADVKSFFDRVKTMFRELIKRIAAAVKTWLSRLSATFRSDKTFYNTYKKEIADGLKKAAADPEYKLGLKGYRFSKEVDTWAAKDAWNTVAVAGGNSPEDILNMAKNVADATADNGKGFSDFDMANANYHDTMDASRGKLLGTSQVGASDFQSEIFKFFRNGATAKVELEVKDFSVALFDKWLGDNGYREISKKAKENYKKLEDAVNTVIRQISAIEAKLNAKKKTEDSALLNKKIAAVSFSVRICRDGLNLVNTVYHGHLAAMRGLHGQCKAAALKFVAVTKKYNKPEAQNASAIMRGVNLI